MGHLIKISAVILLLSAGATQSAPENRPDYYGVIKDVNVFRSTIKIDSYGFVVDKNTEIRNLDNGGNYLRAIKIGQPVLYSKSRGGKLEKLWIYPIDLEKRRQLLGDTVLELNP